MFAFVLSASNINDLSDDTFTITYDTGQLEVLDLCALTKDVELSAGVITGTDIQIIEFTPGTIVFKKSQNIQSGKTWSGIVNCIKFKALADGDAVINYTVQ